MPLINPIPLPLEALLPPPGLFLHDSYLHGQLHVGRVMVLAFTLLDLLDLPQESARLWAAVYLHDLARIHDGASGRHGGDAVARLQYLPDVEELFRRGGLRTEDDEVLATAVTHHSLREIPDDHPHRQLTALLKDADGLDRVRLGDLNRDRLRFDVSPHLIPFAQALHDNTQYTLIPGDSLFPLMWQTAQGLWGRHGVVL